MFNNEKIRLLYQVRVKITLSNVPKVIYCDICQSQYNLAKIAITSDE